VVASGDKEEDMSSAPEPLSVYYWPTPNGHKITLLLEEAGLPYRLHPVNIGKGEQFHPDFLRISPNNKMPALVDPAPADGSGPLAMFESGAILLYLAEKTGRFLPKDLHGRCQVIQWLFWQMSGVGPTLGQNHHFNVYAPEKVPYAIDRFVKESARIYAVLDKQLAGREFIAGDYSIADMACYPWMLNHERQQMKIDEFPEVKRWLAAIGARPATERAFARAKEFATSPVVTDEARRFLFGQDAATVRGRS
jgi:GSH-dependent disulfide-bond oxidoreductase